MKPPRPCGTCGVTIAYRKDGRVWAWINEDGTRHSHRLMARNWWVDVRSKTAAEACAVKAPAKVNLTVGEPITGSNYKTIDCVACLSVPPWEPRCPTCAPEEERLRAEMRARLDAENALRAAARAADEELAQQAHMRGICAGPVKTDEERYATP